MDLKEKAKALPECPGVYLMKDSSGNIIYVGKSKNLRSRVGQYFQSSRNHSPKVVKMVQSIRNFDYITRDTEFEALLLECQLIKKIKPLYNSQMKNDRKYVYIEITVNEEYPRILVSHEAADNNSLFFGPYSSRKIAEKAAAAINDNFKIRSCSAAGFPESSSGCLEYHMGNCIGPCVDAELKKEYLDRINDIIAFFNGKDNNIINVIEDRMRSAAEILDFSRAAKYRDDIYALRHIVNKQRVVNFTRRTGNILVMEYLNESEAKIFLLNDSRLLYEERITITNISKEDLKCCIKEQVLKYFKPHGGKGLKKISKGDIDQAQIVFSYLKKSKDLIYSRIPYSWLNKNGCDKLDKGIDKFIGKLH